MIQEWGTLIVKTIRKLAVAVISIGIVFNLAGCTIGSKFSSPTGSDGASYDYETFHSFDIRELEEQIPSYWSYVEQNEEEQKRMIREAEVWDMESNHRGNLSCRTGYSRGLAYCLEGSFEDIWIERQNESGEMRGTSSG